MDTLKKILGKIQDLRSECHFTHEFDTHTLDTISNYIACLDMELVEETKQQTPLQFIGVIAGTQTADNTIPEHKAWDEVHGCEEKIEMLALYEPRKYWRDDDTYSEDGSEIQIKHLTNAVNSLIKKHNG